MLVAVRLPPIFERVGKCLVRAKITGAHPVTTEEDLLAVGVPLDGPRGEAQVGVVRKQTRPNPPLDKSRSYRRVEFANSEVVGGGHICAQFAWPQPTHANKAVE